MSGAIASIRATQALAFGEDEDFAVRRISARPSSMIEARAVLSSTMAIRMAGHIAVHNEAGKSMLQMRTGTIGWANRLWGRRRHTMPQPEFTDAIALLKADHRKVEDLFEQFEKATASDRKQKLAHEICTELKIHTMLEEEIFYPAFEGKIEEDLLKEAYVEHDGAKVLVNDIEASSPEDEFYDAKVKVLSEEIEHHVKEEEKPVGRNVRAVPETDVDLVDLRDRMIARKEELVQQGELLRPN